MDRLRILRVSYWPNGGATPALQDRYWIDPARDKRVGLIDNLGFGHSGKKCAVIYGRTYMETVNNIS